MKRASVANAGFDVAVVNFKAVLIVSTLVVINVSLLIALFVVSSRFPGVVSPGLLAYTCGLRHAVDADHIAAIDNVTRKLMQEDRKPLTVGLWFSLGHSSVVMIMCAAVATGSSYIRYHLENAQAIGAIVGACVSASMLLLIGSLNAYSACKLFSRWRRIPLADQGSYRCYQTTGGLDHHHDDEHGHTHLVKVSEDGKVKASSKEDDDGIGGFIVRCCPFLFNAIDAEWKMFPLGFLFGLGFDTASEVAILGLAATEPGRGIPAAFVAFLPLLFAAGMCLVDTLDGIMMLWAYGWAVLHPAQKIFFNLYLTSSSAAIALAIGTIEILGLLEQQLHPAGVAWNAIRYINQNSECVGFLIIFYFAMCICVGGTCYKHYFASSQTCGHNGCVPESIADKADSVTWPQNGVKYHWQPPLKQHKMVF